jgi:hypothetical protein
MPARLPGVFLSSTFYDLQHLRAELGSFVTDSLGYQVLASEHATFPVDPDANAVENCMRRVREEADVFVLVVGGRYGHVPADRDRSVTNMEYLAARAKGIPIYVFVTKDVLTILRLYEQEPTGNYSAIVDTPRLLDFVKEIQSEDRVWVRSFEKGKDIVDALRTQFAYRFTAGLEVELRMRSEPESFSGLRGKALRLAVEKPPAWQGLFLVECLRQALERHSADYDAYRSGASWGAGEPVDDIFAWVQRHMADLTHLPLGLKPVVENVLNEAMETCDLRKVASGAELYGDGFKSALDWVSTVRRAHLDEAAEPLRRLLSKAPEEIIAEIVEYPNRLEAEITKALAADSTTKEVAVSFRVRVDPAWVEAVTRELEALKPDEIGGTTG